MPRASVASLFGREAELAEIRQLLACETVRLLTITGPGGTGKTRLAERIAEEAPPPPLSGSQYVDLSAVGNAADVPPTIAAALGVQEAGSSPLPAILRDVITRGPLLLVLDNFERVMDAAGFIAELLAETPDLTCLIASREPLHIRAERIMQIQPLAVPDPQESDVDIIAHSPAVALFVDRGKTRWLDFALSADNAVTIASICRRLDGLPLAIELAAAQIGLLSPRKILERLEVDAPFLVDGARDLPPRHRTLGAAVGWSYDLLDTSAQLVFRRCGVFNGTFDRVAVAAVIDTAPSADPLRTLGQLADKNLLRLTQPTADEPRFRLLQTIQSFALEVLAACNELPETRRKHAAYFLQFAERAEPMLVGPSMGEGLDQLEREYDNFRSVLTWSLDGGDLELGLRLAGALNRFWMMRGHLTETRHWLERALPIASDLPADVRAKAFNTAGVVAGLQGDTTAAEPFFRESYRLWELVGDPTRMAAAVGNLGLVAQDMQDEERALECFKRAEVLYAQAGDRRGIAVSVGSRAHLARQLGRTGEAVELFEMTLELFREVGDPRGIANSLANLGHALIALGKPQASLACLAEALEVRRSLGNMLAVAECLEGFAAAAAARRQGRRAARLLGAAAALRQVTGAPLSPAERREHEVVLQRVQRLLTSSTFIEEQAHGSTMTPDEAADYALGHASAGETQRSPRVLQNVLSERELQVARLVTLGRTNRQIADSLAVAQRTVATHLEHIFFKLGIQSRAEVAAWIVRYDAESRETATPVR